MKMKIVDVYFTAQVEARIEVAVPPLPHLSDYEAEELTIDMARRHLPRQLCDKCSGFWGGYSMALGRFEHTAIEISPRN